MVELVPKKSDRWHQSGGWRRGSNITKNDMIILCVRTGIGEIAPDALKKLNDMRNGVAEIAPRSDKREEKF